MTDDGYTYTLAVITKIPDPDKGEWGNLAHLPSVFYETEEGGWNDDFTVWIGPKVASYYDLLKDKGIDLWDNLPMSPVFVLGQILYLNDWERCIVSGLKPSKWLVETETVATIQEAIALSRKVQGYDD